MALKVIGAGYPRTGTASLKLALEQLGFGPCHHMREIFMNMADVPLWVEAAKNPRQANWEKVFERYNSCTDAPGCTFWRELVDYYPNAKLILSVRDPEKWFESTQATVFSPEWQKGMQAGPLSEFFARAVHVTFDGFIHDHDK
ncbi:MAG: sulfotransferase family protein, partial [Alphaproteobacteria bacterium]